MAQLPTPSLKSIVIKPGECTVLPQDAVIQSIVIDGSATVSSTCGDLPTPEEYACGVFYLFITVNPDATYPLDEENTYYTSLKIGNTTYMIDSTVVQGNNPGTLRTVSDLNVHVPDSALFEFMSVQRALLTDRQRIGLYFKVPASLFDQVELKISDRGTFYYLKPEVATCGEYPEPE